jgi:hypothetical protein
MDSFVAVPADRIHNGTTDKAVDQEATENSLLQMPLNICS